MNGLVGYGSSSEDEDDPKPPTAATAQHTTQDRHTNVTNGANVEKSNGIISEGITTTDEPLQGPMVGPAMPDDLKSTEIYADANDQDVPSMSERDMLRYLTQPTHPISSFPPEPTDDADPVVTAKLRRLLKHKAKGSHFNEDLAHKTSFKNPNLYASLLQRSGLESRAQYSSTLPSDIFSFDMFPEWAYKESLSKSQQDISVESEASKRTQSAAGNRKIEFTPAAPRDTLPKRTYDQTLKRKR